MRYLGLACDYDGTIAHHGQVHESTIVALKQLKESGRKLLLVTGRELPDLLAIFPAADLFHAIIAENGALVYYPSETREKTLGDPPDQRFVALLRQKNILPLSVGKVIVATWHPHEEVVLQTIRDLGLELQVIFNKGAVMVLPTGINKAAGLSTALTELSLSSRNIAGIGDAENDHAFLAICECSVAVANALPSLKERCDLVTTGENSAGVVQLIGDLINNDLKVAEERLVRHHILIGTNDLNQEMYLPAYRSTLLIAGSSGSGKSTLASGIIESIVAKGYQYCIIDPEGDYASLPGVMVMGDHQQPPIINEIIELLKSTGNNVVVNLLGLRLEDRPAFFNTLLYRLGELRSVTGVPHWIVIDEAHQLFTQLSDTELSKLPEGLRNLILVTVHPDQISPTILSSVDHLIVIGKAPEEMLIRFFQPMNKLPPVIESRPLPAGKAFLWSRKENRITMMEAVKPLSEHRRHIRKYAEGELGEDKSFYFRGPEGKLNLRAYNLFIFLQLADGIDDETWMFHLKNGDYSRWTREDIKDSDLALEIKQVEDDTQLSPFESHQKIREAIQKRYTL